MEHELVRIEIAVQLPKSLHDKMAKKAEAMGVSQDHFLMLGLCAGMNSLGIDLMKGFAELEAIGAPSFKDEKDPKTSLLSPDFFMKKDDPK